MTQIFAEYAEIPILMTAEEVAKLLQVSVRTLKRWQQKKLYGIPAPANMTERLVLYRKDDVLAWIESAQERQ